eukprot:COSAG06_NODE_16982_length_969_cov_1.008046_1_plen_52_part_10
MGPSVGVGATAVRRDEERVGGDGEGGGTGAALPCPQRNLLLSAGKARHGKRT